MDVLSGSPAPEQRGHWEKRRCSGSCGPCPTELGSLDQGLLSLACPLTVTGESSLSLQNADSSRTLGAPCGSVWAAASPESAVSKRARWRGTQRGRRKNIKITNRADSDWAPERLLNHRAVKSEHPPDSPAKRLSCHSHGAGATPKYPRRGCGFPRCNHSWSLFMCFVYCCRELSYNQIEHLPSFYRCSSLQEMWVTQPPTPPHAYRAQLFRLHILYTVCVCVCQQRPAA